MKRIIKRFALITMILVCLVSNTYAAGAGDSEGDTIENAKLIGFPASYTGILGGSPDPVDIFKFKSNYTGEVLIKSQADQNGVFVYVEDGNNKKISSVVDGKTYYIRVVNMGDYEMAIRYSFSVTPRIKYGDVNEDGSINSIDFALLRSNLIGTLSPSAKFNEEAADVSGDGYVNSIDFAMVRKYLLGMITSFPAGTYID